MRLMLDLAIWRFLAPFKNNDHVYNETITVKFYLLQLTINFADISSIPVGIRVVFEFVFGHI